MKGRSVLPVIIIVVTIIMSSCVPGGKYKTLHDRSVQYMNDRDNFKIDNLDLSMSNREMSARLKELEDQLDGMEGEKQNLEDEIEEAREGYNNLNNRYTELQKAQEDLIRGNVAETRRLLRELQTAQDNLQSKENLLRQLELEKENINVAHYDMRFVQPLDEAILHSVFKKYNKIITVEDGILKGGFGSAVLEFMCDNRYDSEVKRLGIPDFFIEHGTQPELIAECGFDSKSIIKAVKELLKF